MRRDRCGNSSCCWLGYKSLCRGLLSSAGTDGGAHLQRSYPYSKWQFSSSSLCAPVNCGRPGVDYNGVLYGNDWWVGSVVRYTCRSGFMLMGNPTSLCQPNGLWTPKPSCLREFTLTGQPDAEISAPSLAVLASFQECVRGGASKSVRGS